MSILLRPWAACDLESISRYANNPNIANNLRDTFPHPYTQEDARWFLSYAQRSDPKREWLLAIDLGGTAIGSISATFHRDIRPVSAEIGYWLGEPYWNQGIASTAISQICQRILSQIDVQRIFAEVLVENTASRHALEHCGFQLERVQERSVYKGGQYLDSCTYQLLRQWTESFPDYIIPNPAK